MANGNVPPALRLNGAPAPETPAEAPPEEAAPEGESTFEVTGAAREAFGTECKVGDRYSLDATATEVTPEKITLTLDEVEPEAEEEAPGGESPAAPGPKSAAMTYA